MGKLPKQTKRKDLIRRFKELRFTGPHSGTGDHPQFMERNGRVVKLPNPHRGDIGEALLKKILEQAGVSVAEWLGEVEPAPNAAQANVSAPAKDEERVGRRHGTTKRRR